MRLAPGRAPQRKFAESRRAWDAPGGSGNWEEAGDVHTGSPGPAPRDNSGLEGGVVKEAPGRALLANTGGVIAETG